MTHLNPVTLAAASNDEHMNDLVTIGEVGRPHGLAGELKVRPIVDAPDRFGGLHQVILEAQDGQRARFTIRRVRNQKAESNKAGVISRFKTGE